MDKPITPLLTVDLIIELPGEEGRVVLIERKHEPRGWALPGGFVDIGETVEQAAIREAKEETALDVRLVHLLGVYSDPSRDPRGHTASVVFVASAAGVPRAGDDAGAARLHDASDPPTMAFDHAAILADYCKWRSAMRPHESIH